jgi:mycothiol synthase
MTTQVTIRQPAFHEYAALAAFLGTVRPHHPPEAAEMLHHDQHTPEDRLRLRLIAEQDGAVIGHGSALQSPTYPADFYEVMLDVEPQRRRLGIATSIYHALRRELAGRGSLTLSSEVREDWPAGLALAEKLGFRERMRFWESALDPAACDLARYAERRAAAAAVGYRIVSLREWLAGDRMAAARRLHAALADLQRDVPRAAPYSHPPFEIWLPQSLATPDIVEDGYFIALAGEEIVGVSQLWGFHEPGVFLTGLTAVLPAHRRRGLALALKCRALEYARDAGYHEVRTGNASENHAMIAINDALGFVRYPAWLQMALSVPAG